MQTFDIAAHLPHGLRCGVQPQHREHAANLGQQTAHRLQNLDVLRGAKVLVQVFFSFAQGLSQLTDDAAHGLLVADLVVELLHPRLQRRRGVAIHHALQPLRQNLGVRRHVGFTDIQ